MNTTILGIDVGSTKICSIIAEVRDSVAQIIGTGSCPSQGIKKGAIVNIEQAGRAIRTSIEAARMVSGTEVKKAIVSLSGAHTRSFNVNGSAHIINGEVNIETINSALNIATLNAGIPKDHKIIHVLPHHFKLDDKDYVEDPIGMTGTRLEVEAHIVTVQSASLENLKKSVVLAGVEIENIVLSSYAASIAVLHEDEKDLGIACIDIGAHTCELMIYEGNSMRYNDFLGVGSNHISNDIARVLNTPLKVAEEIKVKLGNLFPSAEEQSASVTIPKIGSMEDTEDVPLRLIYEVMGARVKETLRILSDSIANSGLKKHTSGVVLTGGMANLKGMREFAAAAFSPLSVRIARPIEIGGLFDDLKDSSNAVVVGLILYGAGKFTNYEKDSQDNIRSKHSVLNVVESSPGENRVSLASKPLNGLGEIDLGDIKALGEKPLLSEASKAETKISDEPSSFERFKVWIKNMF